MKKDSARNGGNGSDSWDWARLRAGCLRETRRLLSSEADAEDAPAEDAPAQEEAPEADGAEDVPAEDTTQ